MTIPTKYWKVPQPDQKFNLFKGTDNEKLINLDITEYDVYKN